MGWTTEYKIIISMQKSNSTQRICEVHWKRLLDEQVHKKSEKINFIAVFWDGSTDSAVIKKNVSITLNQY